MWSRKILFNQFQRVCGNLYKSLPQTRSTVVPSGNDASFEKHEESQLSSRKPLGNSAGDDFDHCSIGKEFILLGSVQCECTFLGSMGFLDTYVQR